MPSSPYQPQKLGYRMSLPQNETAVRQRRRRWFSYSMRSLFLVITVVALGMGWVASERRQSQREQEIAEQLMVRGVEVDLATPVRRSHRRVLG